MYEAYVEAGLLSGVWAMLKTAAQEVFVGDTERQLKRAQAVLEDLRKQQETPLLGDFIGQDYLDRAIAAAERHVAALTEELENLKQVERDAYEERERNQRENEKRARDELLARQKANEAALEAARIEKEQESKRQALLTLQDNTIQGLERERAMIGLVTREERIRWEFAEGAYKDMDATTEKRLLQLAKELDALEAYNAIAEEGRRVQEAVRDTANKVGDEIERLNKLLEAGVISFDNYRLAVAQAKDALAELPEKTKDEFSDLQRAIEGWGRDSAAAITDFALYGKNTFSDMVNSMIADMMRMIIYKRFMEPLFGAISGHVSDFSFGAEPRARGGPVMPGGTYLVGERGPELLHMGNKGGSIQPNIGGSVNNINITASSKPQVSETPNSSGGMDIEIVFDEMMSKKGSQRGSQFNKMLRNTYGAREGLISR
jgi:hypothetical protein